MVIITRTGERVYAIKAGSKILTRVRCAFIDVWKKKPSSLKKFLNYIFVHHLSYILSMGFICVLAGIKLCILYIQMRFIVYLY